MNDRYERAKQFILNAEDPKQAAQKAWAQPSARRDAGGVLFLFCTPSGFAGGEQTNYGCLSMVREQTAVAFNEDLTADIQADERLPCIMQHIEPTEEGLELFAEWQRKMDAMWPGRNPEEKVSQEQE